MSEWLYDKIQRVPEISDEQITAMRHIEPVLRDGESGMYRRIIGIGKIDPRKTSFLWDAKPTGQEFTFHQLNVAKIVTQHHSSVFFKPSLAEVYAWMLVYMPESWGHFTHFCLGEPKRIGSSTDIMCECEVMGGELLVRGQEYVFANGEVGHQLVASSST
jgi:hypothetical protein